MPILESTKRIIKSNLKINLDDIFSEKIKLYCEWTGIDELEQFSSKDISALTDLDYLNMKTSQYTVVSKKQSKELNKMVIVLHKKGEAGYSTKTADEVAGNEEILGNLNPKEAYMIGYMAATEQFLREEDAKKSAKAKATTNHKK